ncbi:hypothetical protein QLH51_18330 [Sphingomonas sp. 2R-10]|uniref:hypothetical protein n=1 Tax=Sphingomonas sp. 2R-10 TaxID=3045148 RepID=UPI000F795ECD|nr:hypothetical protein [Sphingomonas sp. 2R-10]MDJ0278753.1 hypothetical protein [Sphingomonas sp. 2R-10]
MRRALLALSVLAGCSGEPPPPAPQPSVQPTPAPLPSATRSPRPLRPGQLPTPELDGAVPLAGNWSATPGAATYRFEGGTVFAIRCDRAARRIVLSRGVGEGDTISLFTDNAAATFPAQVVDGALETPVTTGQTFLDALADAEVFAVASGKSPVLRVPGDKAIGAVVRGCRPAGR